MPNERCGKHSVKINMTHRRLLENSGENSDDVAQGRMTMDPVLKTPDMAELTSFDQQHQSGTTSFIGALLSKPEITQKSTGRLNNIHQIEEM